MDNINEVKILINKMKCRMAVESDELPVVV